DAAAATLETAREEAARAAALVAWIEPLLTGEAAAEGAPAADEETTRRITGLSEAQSALAALQVTLIATRAQEAALSAALTRATKLLAGFRARRPALTAWHALAQDKMANQDVYLQALNADIAAVEERLRGMTETGESPRASATVCDAERASDQTPLAKHNS